MSLDLREQDPGSARFNAVSLTVVLSLLGCIVGFVSAGLLFGDSALSRWAFVVFGATIGGIPLAQWRRNERLRPHVDLFGIEPSLQPLLRRAAEATDRIERAATTAAPGPVADVIDENHRSALAHVKLLGDDARRAGPAYRTELLRQCHQLEQLAGSSERLLHRSLEAQPTVLNALTERTELIREALQRHELANPEVSAGSDERDHEDRDATNDH